MKNILKSIRIWTVHHIREFLGIDREIAQIRRDIMAVMEKELNRDQQYPIEDKEALPVEAF